MEDTGERRFVCCHRVASGGAAGRGEKRGVLASFGYAVWYAVGCVLFGCVVLVSASTAECGQWHARLPGGQGNVEEKRRANRELTATRNTNIPEDTPRTAPHGTTPHAPTRAHSTPLQMANPSQQRVVSLGQASIPNFPYSCHATAAIKASPSLCVCVVYTYFAASWYDTSLLGFAPEQVDRSSTTSSTNQIPTCATRTLT